MKEDVDRWKLIITILHIGYTSEYARRHELSTIIFCDSTETI